MRKKRRTKDFFDREFPDHVFPARAHGREERDEDVAHELLPFRIKRQEAGERGRRRGELCPFTERGVERGSTREEGGDRFQ